tara:strand:+ start:1006 stop:1146 length:141 start_codon:yes stop_codon:yes gene_type:complete
MSNEFFVAELCSDDVDEEMYLGWCELRRAHLSKDLPVYNISDVVGI